MAKLLMVMIKGDYYDNSNTAKQTPRLARGTLKKL